MLNIMGRGNGLYQRDEIKTLSRRHSHGCISNKTTGEMEQKRNRRSIKIEVRMVIMIRVVILLIII